jgi:hypothetical protein
MGAFSMTALLAGGAILGTVTIDIMVNAAQDWYHVVYADAFWSNRITDTPALRDLGQEEEQINALLRASEQFSGREIQIAQPRRPAP